MKIAGILLFWCLLSATFVLAQNGPTQTVNVGLKALVAQYGTKCGSKPAKGAKTNALFNNKKSIHWPYLQLTKDSEEIVEVDEMLYANNSEYWESVEGLLKAINCHLEKDKVITPVRFEEWPTKYSAEETFSKFSPQFTSSFGSTKNIYVITNAMHPYRLNGDFTAEYTAFFEVKGTTSKLIGFVLWVD